MRKSELTREKQRLLWEEEEYIVTILRVTLTVTPLESIVAGRMDTEQAEIFAAYTETKGGLQVFGTPVDYYWYYYISSYYGYRKNPNTGAEELHRGVDIAVPTGTVVYAAHDGTVMEAAYDSYYGNYVVITDSKQTLEYTQSLYEKKLVTYPRTDSQYLSDDMEGTAKNVIEAIFNSLLFEQNIMFNPDIKRILNSKKVTDHHAIIPTMEIIKQDLKVIPESEMKILSLCANRLLCATGEKHIYNSTKAELTCNEIVFKVSGKEVWKNGWKEFDDFFKNSYKTTEDKSDAEEEKKLPELREGMMIAVEQTKVSEHFTQPPKHYTDVIFCERKAVSYTHLTLPTKA